jgi:predicted metallo-beta-lactamase superfamily hydrolase
MNLETGEAMDELTGPVQEWCQQHGVEISTVSEFLEKKDEKLMKAIQDGIDRYNSRAISRAQKVCNHHLLYPPLPPLIPPSPSPFP